MVAVTKPKSRILCINAGLGSHLIAAKHLNYPVIGSYDSTYFGLASQRLNFENVVYRSGFSDWPEKWWDGKNLKTVSVIMTRRKPTAIEDELDWILGKKVVGAALDTITSPAIFACEQEIFMGLAQKHGYQMYITLYNTGTFGVPRWRKKAFVFFLRKNLQLPYMYIEHQHFSCGSKMSALYKAVESQPRNILSLLHGLPEHYKYPEMSLPRLRFLLQRDTCPFASMWALETMERNLYMRPSYYKGVTGGPLKHSTFVLRPGDTANLIPTKQMWEEFCSPMTLRNGEIL